MGKLENSYIWKDLCKAKEVIHRIISKFLCKQQKQILAISKEKVGHLFKGQKMSPLGYVGKRHKVFFVLFVQLP